MEWATVLPLFEVDMTHWASSQLVCQLRFICRLVVIPGSTVFLKSQWGWHERWPELITDMCCGVAMGKWQWESCIASTVQRISYWRKNGPLLRLFGALGTTQNSILSNTLLNISNNCSNWYGSIRSPKKEISRSLAFSKDCRLWYFHIFRLSLLIFWNKRQLKTVFLLAVAILRFLTPAARGAEQQLWITHSQFWRRAAPILPLCSMWHTAMKCIIGLTVPLISVAAI